MGFMSRGPMSGNGTVDFWFGNIFAYASNERTCRVAGLALISLAPIQLTFVLVT